MPDDRNRQWIRSGTLCLSLLLSATSTLTGQLGRRGADETGGRLQRPAAPEYDLIALRVEFQPDESRFSTGDGVFGGSMFEGLEPSIDPFPHDDAYFDAHLEFLSNYVRRVSRGQTVVQTHLLPEIVRVSGVMGDYAPTGPDADSAEQRARLRALVNEAWTLADDQIDFDAVGFDPARTAFVIFHAGTGRDIELTGTVLDRTPEDLPSLFFGASDLSNNELEFKGLSVSNTALIPETESKRGVDPLSDEPFLLELSINGLLAASFFNYLGAPDLFNTTDGSSAIGPFGLMDALGIFAYGGLLPPEPSGWTRFYLGWTTPVELSGVNEREIELRAHIDQALVPVSSTEYFLVEVRHRDVESDGLNLKVWKDGALVDQRFDADSEDFTSFDQSGFEGVLVDADDFDWALPGGYDDTQVLRNGGVLIWHVDEQVIAAGLESNAVNVDPARRGVDLEEADSAQDLGFPSGNQFAPDFDRGTPFDFFFEGNPVSSITATGQVALYANRFGSDTYPNSNSNGGGPSFIVLDEFGPVSTSMALRYRREEGGATPIEFSTPSLNMPFGFGSSVSVLAIVSGSIREDILLYHTGSESDVLWLVPLSGSIPSRIDGIIGKPVVHAGPAGSDALSYVARDDADELYFTRYDPALERPQFVVPFPTEVRLALPSTQLIGINRGSEFEYYVGFDFGDTGHVVVIRSGQTSELVTSPIGGVLSLAALPDGDLLVVGRDRTQVWRDEVPIDEWVYDRRLGSNVGQVAAGRDPLGTLAAIPFVDEGKLILLGNDGRVVEVEFSPGQLSPWPVLADIDTDGILEVVVTAGASLQSFGREGAVTRGFPIPLPANSDTQPLIANFPVDGEGRPHVFLALTDGYMHAISPGSSSSVAPPFPLALGGRLSATPLIVGGTIYSVAPAGNLMGWDVDNFGGSTWSSLYGDGLNGSFVDAGTDPAPGGNGDELIVKDETYNWPNPVREGLTRLRIATVEPSTVKVSIIDMAGNLVHSLEGEASLARVPVEFEWRPDVESGVYFARVEAETAAGRQGTRLYSIAIVR